MTLGTILVPLWDAPEDRRCLKAARALAKRMPAHISALYVMSDATAQLESLMLREVQIPESVLAHQAALNADHCRAVERDFAAWRDETERNGDTLVADDHTSSLHVAIGNRRTAISKQALVADIVVTSLPGHTHPYRFDAITAAVFAAGKPVFALPMQAPSPAFAVDQIAAIAWNGSKAASRAVSAALPLLRDCAEIIVIAAGGDTRQVEPLLSYLHRHSVRATGRTVPGKGEVGAAIHRLAHEVGARFLVMGATGRSIARDYGFGATTHFMLQNATIPLFLAG